LLCGAKASKKKHVVTLLESTLRLHRRVKGAGKQAAIDSTGYEAGHTSVYYGKRAKLKKSHFPKLTTVCQTKTHLYLSAVANQGPFPDHREFAEAATQAHKLRRYHELLADAGYDAEHHHKLSRDTLGVRSIINPKAGRPTSKPARGRYRRLMQTRFPKDKYHQRWQIESAWSQDKRRFGSYVRGRSYHARRRNLFLRVLVHNVALVQRHSSSFQQSRTVPFFYSISA